MQHTQFRVVWTRIRFPVLALALICAPNAFAAGIAHESRPDPLLDGAPDGPCADLAQGPDYAPGTDAQGHAVVPADVGAPPVAIPDQIAVPLHMGQGRRGGDSAYATIDGRRLAPLVNPPACGRPR